jgi:chromosomal replication initiator protein
MLACKTEESWKQFIDCIQKRISSSEFQNWFSAIILMEATDDSLTLQIPNIFVQRYLLDNYKQELTSFLPQKPNGDPAIQFIIQEPERKKEAPVIIQPPTPEIKDSTCTFSLNPQYVFENFIEGPSNQFVKSAALGVATRPGKSFNPLFIHGGVGLGKTHLLHGIGHYLQQHHKKLLIHCITTENFINDLVFHLRNKSIDKMKKFYRSLDVLLVDDIQFLQNRQNFEEEFSNTFESLINQHKQIVITSDKAPSQLKLSERIVARMEWGLVANVGVPELETRVAIIQHKAHLKGVSISNSVAFFIADHIYQNIRQIEGAINRLCAYSRLLNVPISEETAENVLKEMMDFSSQKTINVDAILKSVSQIFEVKISDLKGDSKLKNIAFARQVAMYLAKEILKEDSLSKIASSFGGKTHSTLLHAWKKISEELEKNTILQKQIQMAKKNLDV